MELYLTVDFPLENQGKNSGESPFAPKRGLRQLSSAATISSSSTFTSPYSSVRFDSNVSSANASDQVTISAATRRILGENSDLLRIIAEDQDLTELLRGSEVISRFSGNPLFMDRQDLEGIIIQGALDKLGDDSPITGEFLEDNLGLAKLIARDVGGITDILKEDEALSRSLVADSLVTGATMINDVVGKTREMLNSDSPITEDFLRNNLEATLYLAGNPTLVGRLNSSRDLAQDFRAHFNERLDSYKSTIQARAGESIDEVAVYSAEFLDTNYDLARLVMASDLGGSSFTLANYLQHRTLDVSEEFRTTDFVKGYEAELAGQRLRTDFPVEDDFFAKNRAMVLAVLGSDELVKALEEDEEAFAALFEIPDTTWQDRVRDRVPGSLFNNEPEGRLSSLVDLFV